MYVFVLETEYESAVLWSMQQIMSHIFVLLLEMECHLSFKMMTPFDVHYF